MRAALVIMAAGLGSRFGGYKQITGLGPNGEFLMEYAIHDAQACGFTKVVFIIKPEMLESIREICGDRLSQQIQVEYCFQDFSSVPAFYDVPAERVKPFGTVHAVLCAKGYVDEPFAVLNADDYYGAGAIRAMYDSLKQLTNAGQATMVAYRLKNTVSANGGVTRGVCTEKNGLLTDIEETKNIVLRQDGTIVNGETGETLSGESLVSMNFWGFTPGIFAYMGKYFDAFLKMLPAGEMKAECLLPTMVGDMIKENKLQVSVHETEETWFGVTYPQDRPAVEEALKSLHASGIYPKKL